MLGGRTGRRGAAVSEALPAVCFSLQLALDTLLQLIQKVLLVRLQEDVRHFKLPRWVGTSQDWC